MMLMDEPTMSELDLRGYDCPMPVVKVMKFLEKNPGAVVAVLVDKESACDDIARFARKKGYSIDWEKTAGAYRVRLRPVK